jgi:hypothetical protein
MDIEIHTTTGSWITYVDDQEFSDQDAGAAARSVGDRIKAGEPIEVTAAASAGRLHARREEHMAIFNPGHVVAVVAMGWRAPRPARP